jgi:hypothetical protein
MIHPNPVLQYAQPDLSGAAQLELYDRLVDATTIGGVDDIAGWLAEQDWCAPSDWLAVARLWGGNMLRDHLAAQLARKGLVPA